MALIKHAQTAELTRTAVVLNLGDLHRQGQVIVQRAKDAAEKILVEGQEERRRIVAGAAETGRNEGLAVGVAEGRRVGAEAGRVAALEEHRAALTKLEAGWGAALDQFLERRSGLEAEARRDVLKLAALIASRVTRRAIVLDPTLVETQFADVLALVLRPTRLIVSVNPADRELAQLALPGLQRRFASAAHVEFTDDPAIERGGCAARIADAGGGEIDANIATQLDRIVEALLPGTAPESSPKA